jgi:hypothetical protein
MSTARRRRFYFVLAEMTENPILQRQAKELVSRTLILVTF